MNLKVNHNILRVAFFVITLVSAIMAAGAEDSWG